MAMTAEEITRTLQELEGVDKRALTLDNKNTISQLYGIVLQKTFHATSCNDCYHDAIIEMLCYLRKYGAIKPVRKYRLKAGALLQKTFGSSVFYTDVNITDDVAREFLRSDKSRVDLFSVLPDNWQQDIEQNASQATEMANTGVSAQETAKPKRKRARKTAK